MFEQRKRDWFGQTDKVFVARRLFEFNSDVVLLLLLLLRRRFLFFFFIIIISKRRLRRRRPRRRRGTCTHDCPQTIVIASRGDCDSFLLPFVATPTSPDALPSRGARTQKDRHHHHRCCVRYFFGVLRGTIKIPKSRTLLRRRHRHRPTSSSSPLARRRSGPTTTTIAGEHRTTTPRRLPHGCEGSAKTKRGTFFGAFFGVSKCVLKYQTKNESVKKQKAMYARARPLSAGRLEDSALRDPQAAFSLTKRASPKASQRVERNICICVCIYNEISYICV